MQIDNTKIDDTKSLFKPTTGVAPVDSPFKKRTAKISPCEWNLSDVDGELTAVNSNTGEVFTGTREAFNEFMRG